MNKRLERIPEEGMIGGVSAGLSRYFNLDPTLIRVLFVVGIFLPHFPSILIYIILWIALPERAFGTVGTYESTEPLTKRSFTMNPYPPSNNANTSGSIIGGIVLVLLGVFFLLDQWFDIDFGKLWPLILIAVGVWIIFKDRIRRNDPPYRDEPPYNSGSTPYDVRNDPTNPNNPL